MLSPPVAVAATALFVLVSVPVSLWLDPAFAAILFGYLLLNIAYSFSLKHVVIVGNDQMIPFVRVPDEAYIATSDF